MNKKIFRPFAGLLLLSAACLGQTPTTNITAAAPIVVSAPTGYIQISCPGCAGTAGPVVLANGTTATTQPYAGDATTKVATDQFVQNAINYSMATVPMTLSTGTYSFDAASTCAPTIGFTASGNISAITLTSSAVFSSSSSYVCTANTTNSSGTIVPISVVINSGSSVTFTGTGVSSPYNFICTGN